MKVTEQDVLYVADLASLELTPAEQSAMVHDLNAILGYTDMLNELDTTGVEPMASVSTIFAADEKGESPALRADQPAPGLSHDDALRNAPDTDGNFFRVPKVIER